MELRRARDGYDPRFLGEQPGERDLRRSGLLLLCESAKYIDQRLIGLAILRREARDDVAEILLVELRLLVDRTGQEAFAERAKGNESDAEFFERRDDFSLRLSPPERIFALESRHGLDFVCATNRLDAGFGEAEVPDLALLNEVLHGSGDILNRHVGIDAVLIEEVDDIGLESFQRGLGDLADVLGPAIDSSQRPLGFRIDFESELGCDHDLIPEGSERLADQFFVGERAVSFGGIEECDTTFEGSADERDAERLFDRGTEAGAQSHAAEAERRNFQIACSEFALLHGFSF